MSQQPTDPTESGTGGEGVQTSFSDAPTTYPESWQESVGTGDTAHGPYPMPGSVTMAAGPEHPNAKEQQYYLQDEESPVTKGDHKRNVLPRT